MCVCASINYYWIISIGQKQSNLRKNEARFHSSVSLIIIEVQGQSALCVSVKRKTLNLYVHILPKKTQIELQLLEISLIEKTLRIYLCGLLGA